MADDGGQRWAFSDEFDDSFPVGAEPGNSAFFGRNVLRGLIDGIDDLIHAVKSDGVGTPRSGRATGLSHVVNDAELLDKIGELDAACVVVSKQGRKTTSWPRRSRWPPSSSAPPVCRSEPSLC